MCIYRDAFKTCDVITATEMIGYSVFFRSVEWNEDSKKLAALTSTNSFIMFSLTEKKVLWEASLVTNPNYCIGSFCVDLDDSIFYITKPRGIHRIGISDIEESLLEQGTGSSISELLSSPRKLISASTSRVTEKSFSFLNSAISKAKDIVNKDGFENFAQGVNNETNMVDEIGCECVSNLVAALQEDSADQDFPPSNIIEEHSTGVLLQRKEKGISRKKEGVSEDNIILQCAENDSTTINSDEIWLLRKEVFGGVVIGTPSGSLTSTSECRVESHQYGDSDVESVEYDSVEHKVSKKTPSVEPKSSVDSEGASCVSNALSNEVARSPESQDSLSSNADGAESIDVAYQYLLHKNPLQSNSCIQVDLANQFANVRQVDESSNKHSNENVVLNNHSDIWSQIILPYTAKSFAVSNKHLLLCHKKKNVRFINLDHLGFKKPNWQVAKWSAENVSMNDDESIIWCIKRHIGWSAIEPLSTTTRFEECAVDGEVSLQMELPDKAIFSSVDRDWPMKSISVADQAVWAIRSDTGSLVVRVGLGRCRMGLDWVEITPEGPSKLVSVCVFRTYGFALDDNGHLWLSTGVDQYHPYGGSDAFYKIHTPVIDGRTTNVGTWNIRFLREIPSKFGILDNFSIISAGSFQGKDGFIHVCRQNSEIFVYRPTRRNFITVSTPQGSCAIVSLCGAPGKLFVVDSSGRLFYSDGESSSWNADISLSGPICSFANGNLGSWAIDCGGAILFKPKGMDTWRSILSPSDLDIVPMQIFSSPNGIYVWLLANGRGFARSNISDRTPSGLRWLETFNATEFSTFAIGNNIVWALDSAGLLYKLRGLAASNPAGNYWKPYGNAIMAHTVVVLFYPDVFYIKAISIDAQNQLWAIDNNNRLVRHMAMSN
ncbi:hypothetical protein DICVIV_00382 [Dictyocaulus viviparus]|uniref:Propeller n=1 Tax=Dictyocaulus viviparus TaxID=29172 RepID=A0A0D8YBN0_DICVI|nr:hypothetical protein DICVIV_00382 [Dictyocaulus viviparus]